MSEQTFKVIKIIDEYKIIINGGTNDHLSKGDELEVYIPGETVFDPETDEDMGTLDPIKAYVEIRNVYPKMAVCVNVNKQPVTDALALISGTAAKMLATAPKKLSVHPEDISGGLDYDFRIRVGDLVRPCRG